ncbi:Deoxyribodipyrimidine photo-lyase type II [Propionispira arboris]|uniref:Deoxyribodipyrimidine photo-lyase n=1 Tax=Propionispira arboris TaxID=84035 RepID=A0A1H7BVW4_9FIRM|nr:deoxyribodipyrimidine photo-lyase [Propionispira arboris]SEJ78842.1 Deoxyribodipyrimidine photo-lyase type II [Propionispira arboris]
MIDQRRIRIIQTIKNSAQNGPVVYWMSRDQRVEDNWALYYAQQTARKQNQPLVVLFALAPDFIGATLRQYGFMLRGLTETAQNLTKKNIPFYLLIGSPAKVIATWLQTNSASTLIIDFDPLKIKALWKKELLQKIKIPCYEVDAHNIVPCWTASTKLEYAAYTIRPKIQRLLSEFLLPVPEISVHPASNFFIRPLPPVTDLLAQLKVDTTVSEITWLKPGSKAGKNTALNFIQEKLQYYDKQSNDPTKNMQSNLSPYLHFGQISAQKIALHIKEMHSTSSATESFLEELIIRRELADNFCFYQTNYDNAAAFPAWAQKTLQEHLDDSREYLYNAETLEQAFTHDPLWNAAQRQMTETGKMHGYVRMYWAKKILEWSRTPADAMSTAIYLNDKYHLDGRDPNGYAGIAWSMGGLHDRAWSERNVFGKIRYMNFNGMKRKFPIQTYIDTYPPFDQPTMF